MRGSRIRGWVIWQRNPPIASPSGCVHIDGHHQHRAAQDRSTGAARAGGPIGCFRAVRVRTQARIDETLTDAATVGQIGWLDDRKLSVHEFARVCVIRAAQVTDGRKIGNKISMQ